MKCEFFPYEQYTWEEGHKIVEQRKQEHADFVAVFEPTDTVVTIGKDTLPLHKMKYPYPTYEYNRDGGVSLHAPGHTLITAYVHVPRSNLYLSLIKAGTQVLSEVLQRPVTFQNTGFGLMCDGQKIAAIGLGYENNRSFYGMSVYFENDESLNLITPCSIGGVPHTSISKIDASINKEEVSNLLGRKLVDLIS
jgi:lipoate-protein ligase B